MESPLLYLRKFKNLFPADTRIAELTSGISLFFTAALTILTGGITSTCMIILLAIGSLQLFSLMTNRFEYIRVYLSLIVGAMLLYSGVHGISDPDIFKQISQIVLGIANLYAFLINNQRLVWK